MHTCQRWDWLLQILITSPVVSWRGWETPPQAPRLSCHSLLNHGRVKTSLSVVACCSTSATPLFTFGGWTGSSSTVSLSIFFLFIFLVMSRELRICPGVGDRKCGAFLSTLDRDPHPTCARCRGKICTKDLTCDFCAAWSAEQLERFDKKRSYKERKKHRPSGSVPPTQQTSPRAETSSGVSRLGTSFSSSSRPLGGQGKQEGSRGAPGVVSGGAPSPPARPRSSKRGGSTSGRSSGAGGLAPVSPSPSGVGGAGVARSLQTPISRVSDVVDSPQFSPHVP